MFEGQSTVEVVDVEHGALADESLSATCEQHDEGREDMDSGAHLCVSPDGVQGFDDDSDLGSVCHKLGTLSQLQQVAFQTGQILEFLGPLHNPSV